MGNCPGRNFIGGNCLGDSCPEGELFRDNCLGVKVKSLGGNCLGGGDFMGAIVRGGSCSEENCH